LVCNNPVFFQ